MPRMRSVVPMLLLCLAVVATVVWLVDFGGGTADGTHDSAKSRSKSVEGRRGAKTDEAADTKAADPERRTKIDVTAGPDVVFAGRCVRVGGVSLTGVEVGLRLHRNESRDPRVELEMPAALDLVRTAVSGADGRFEIRFPLVCAGENLVLTAAAPHCTDWKELSFDRRVARKDRRVELGDVRISDGYRVAGTIVNQDGEPIVDDLLELGHAFAVVDEGRFEFLSVGAGEHAPDLSKSGEVVSPQTVRVGPGHDATNLRLVVNEPPFAAGVVLDLAGRPVPAMTFHFEQDGSGGGYCSTDTNGRFRVHTWSVDRRYLRFIQGSYPGGKRPMMLTESTAWMELPRKGLVLRAKPWPTFLIRGRRSDGSVAKELSVFIGMMPANRVGEPVDGVHRFHWLSVGRREFFIRVFEPYAFAHVSFDPADHTTTPFEVQLVPTRELEVRVGEAKVKCTVEDAKSHYFGARTEDDGRCRFSAPDRIAGLTLVLEAPGRRVEVPLTAEHDRTRIVTVELPPRPASVEPPTVRIVLEGPDHQVWATVEELRRRRVGSHELLPVSRYKQEYKPGKWEICVIDRTKPRVELPKSRQTRPALRVLETVELKLGDARRIELDVPLVEPAYVDGTATLQGKPLRDRWLEFNSADHRELVKVEAEGRLRAQYFVPGRYVVSVDDVPVPGVTSVRTLYFPEAIELGHDQLRTLRLDFGATSQRIRVLTAAGGPAARVWLDIPNWGPFRTDALGEAELPGLHPDWQTFVVTTRPVPGTKPQRLTVTRGAGTVEVRLPPR